MYLVAMKEFGTGCTALNHIRLENADIGLNSLEQAVIGCESRKGLEYNRLEQADKDHKDGNNEDNDKIHLFAINYFISP